MNHYTTQSPNFSYGVKHIICYSGGHSSAIVAIAATEKYGKENIILLNHDINASTEHPDIKRFKNEVSDYLNIPITYANMPRFNELDQFDICIKEKAFKTNNTPGICTNRLKTEPFYKWIKTNKITEKNAIIYYGFDANEQHRIIRRRRILKESLGLNTCFPLSDWNIKIKNTSEINIIPPLTYSVFKHANCTGCLKGGIQHWYCVYCKRPDLFDKAKYAEKIIKHSIIKNITMQDLEIKFNIMQNLKIKPSEHIQPQKFWTDAKKYIKQNNLNIEDEKPCECSC